MDKPLATTLADIVGFLRSKEVPYALVGGLAVPLRGQPRVTVGIVERALVLAGSLRETNFTPLFDNVADVVEKALLLPLRHSSTSVKVDLAIGLSGFEQQAIARAELLELAGLFVSVATAEDLLIMKVLAGRPQDEQDLRGFAGDRWGRAKLFRDPRQTWPCAQHAADEQVQRTRVVGQIVHECGRRRYGLGLACEAGRQSFQRPCGRR